MVLCGVGLLDCLCCFVCLLACLLARCDAAAVLMFDGVGFWVIFSFRKLVGEMFGILTLATVTSSVGQDGFHLTVGQLTIEFQRLFFERNLIRRL